jgi:molybdenum cofactor guanylyltransferase
MADKAANDVAGLLLTGGSSRRFGSDKARLLIEGIALARRVASAVAVAVDPVLEVGLGVSGLASIGESPAGEGPLVALVCGVRELHRLGHTGAVLVVACDLPFVRSEGLEELARWPTHRSVLPVVAGRAQPLCARWAPDDCAVAVSLVSRGERSMRALIEATQPLMLDVVAEAGALTRDQLEDLDTREDARRLGVEIAFAPEMRALAPDA